MARTRGSWLLVVAVWASSGCTEYQVGVKPSTPSATTPALTTSAEPSPPDSTPPDTVPADPTTDPTPPGTTTEPVVVTLSCTDDWSDTLPWVRSPIWTAAEVPVDADGDHYYDAGFEVPPDWLAVGALPDEDPVPENHDLFYRATFNLDAVVGATDISFIGNDGVWLYANGWFLGHWGSAWRQGGCINVDDGSCTVNTDAPPADLTPFLRAGTNTLAVMLTNGPTGYYLDIDANCVE